MNSIDNKKNPPFRKTLDCILIEIIDSKLYNESAYKLLNIQKLVKEEK